MTVFNKERHARRSGLARHVNVMSNIGTNDLSHFEIITPDVDGTKSFYEKNFGWKFQQFGPEFNNYVMGTLPNGVTCGVRKPEGPEKPGVLNYVLVQDVKRSLADAKATGAMVVQDAMEIPGMGWMGVFVGPGGVPFAVWQSAQK